MEDQFSRTRMLLGSGLDALFRARVAVFGIGGVGGFAVEALARSGVGEFMLVDSDTVSLANINRQIVATHSTVGRKKVAVMRERILDINPNALIEIRDCFYMPENSDSFDLSKFSYIVDAVDIVTAKVEIISKAKSLGVPVISAMGAGNKIDPTKFRIADIAETSVCPLAKAVRRELKKRGISGVKVVFSTEPPRLLEHRTGSALGSVAFVPSVAAFMIAGEVIKDLARLKL